jgi:cytochrome c oxidase assembly protein subunit 19
MAKDEFKNLGFGEDKPAVEDKKDDADKGKKGELRW